MSRIRPAVEHTQIPFIDSPLLPYLPPGITEYIPRPGCTGQACKALLSCRAPDHVRAVSFKGQAGSGKKTLARVLCDAPEIKKQFENRLFLFQVGANPADLLDQINEIGDVLFSEWEYETHVDSSIRQLADYLAPHDTLFIFTDVFNVEQALHCTVRADHIATLLTTSNERIAGALQIDEIVVDAFTDNEIAAFFEHANALPVFESTVQARAELRLPLLTHLAQQYYTQKEEVPTANAAEPLPITTTSIPEAYHVLIERLLAGIPERLNYLIQGMAIFPPSTPLSYPVLSSYWRCLCEDLTEQEETQLLDYLVRFRIIQHRHHSNTAELSTLFHTCIQGLPALDIHSYQHAFLSLYPVSELADITRSHDEYIYRHISYHFNEADQLDVLSQLLMHVSWLYAKVNNTPVESLLADFRYVRADKTLRIVEEAIRLSTQTLAIDQGQFFNQLIGRLKDRDIPAIQHLVLSLRTFERNKAVWLEPVNVYLSTPASALIHTFQHNEDAVHTVTYCPRSNTVVSTASAPSIQTWDLETNAPKSIIESALPLDGSIALTHDEQTLLSTSSDHAIHVWNLADGTLQQSLFMHSARVLALNTLPDNQRLLSSDESGALLLSNIRDGKIITSFTPRCDLTWAIATTPEHHIAFTAGNGESIESWDLRTGHARSILNAHEDWIWCLHVTSDGQYLVSASEDHTIIIWDLFNAKALKVLQGHHSGVRHLSVAYEDRLILSADEEQTIIAWDFDTGSILRTFSGLSNGLNDIELVPHRQSMLVASQEPELRQWSIARHDHHLEQHAHVKGVRFLVLSHDDKRLISAADDTRIMSWDATSGVRSHVLDGHSDWISDLKIASRSSQIVSCSFDSTIVVWDMESNRRQFTLEGHDDWIWCIALSHDDSFVVSGSEDCTLNIWNLKTGRFVRSLRGHTAGVTHVCISDNNKYIISASLDRSVRVWSAEDGTLIHTLAGHTDKIQDLVLSPIDQRIITASDDQSIRFWNFQFGYQAEKYMNQRGAVRHIRPIMNGLMLASISEDQSLSVWDLVRTEPIFSLEGHSGPISDLSISGSSKWGATSGYDKTLCLWDLERGELVDRYMADYPITCCTFSRDNNRVIGADAGGGLHFLSINGDVF